MTVNARQTRCFIIDDDEDDQEILTTAIKKSILGNHICAYASDGEEALASLHSDSLPDIIFLDLNMPRMNGMQCLSAIRKAEKFRHLPVVIYSTSTDESVSTEAMQLGATAFISKPVRLSDLVNSLNNFFAAHSQFQAA